MPETGIVELLRDYWAIIVGFVGVVFGYGRQNQRVTAQAQRIDKLEEHLHGTLKDIKEDVKDLNRKVDVQQAGYYQLQLDILSKLNKLDD